MPYPEVPTYTVTQFKKKSTDYAVLIPVINEGQRLLKQLEEILQFHALVDFFIIDGGSQDGSTEHSNLAKKGLCALLVKTGPGKLSAQLRCGYDFLLKQGYKGIIIVDGNGKDNLQAIPVFVQALVDGWDHIQGSRFIPGGKHQNTPLSRFLGIKLLHAPLISIAAGTRYTDTTNGFRGYSAKLLSDSRVLLFRDIFSTYEIHYYLAIRAARLGFRCKEIPVERNYPSSEVPTKIKGIKGNLKVLVILFKSCLGFYNPKNQGQS